MRSGVLPFQVILVGNSLKYPSSLSLPLCYVAPSRGKLSTEEVILTSAARAREIKTQKFGLPKFSPSQIGRKGKAQGQKAKGTEFEPRRSQNFLLKPLRPRAFSSRQEGEY